MTFAAIRINFDQAFDVECCFTAKVAFNFIFRTDDFTNFLYFVFCQVANAGIRVYASLSQDLLGRRKTNT